MAARSGVEVQGLRETVRSLERLGTEVQDLKDAFKRIGNIVVDEAQARAPKKSGALAASIKASNTKNKSNIRAGSAKVPYAGVHEWGWPSHNITGTHYLTGASQAKQGEVIQALNVELGDLIRKLDLK